MTLMNGRFVMNTVLNPKLVAATLSALTATYANGTAGVGATLTATTNVVFPSIDGVSVTVGQVILVKNQASSFQNGLYTLTDAGVDTVSPWVLTRHPYADINLELQAGHIVVLSGGSTLKAHIFALQDSVAVVGTDPVVYNDTDPTAATRVESTEIFTLDAGMISAKQVTLAHTPFTVANTHVFIVGGENQVYGDDYTVSGTTLSWSGLGMEPILVAGMQLVVNYIY